MPCVGHGRWLIAYLLEKLAAGATAERLVADHPGLTLADFQLALAVAAWVMRDPSIAWADLGLAEIVALHDELRAWQALSDETLGSVDDPPHDH